MSLKMIKDAQTINKLGDKVDFYQNAKTALGVESITEAVRILKEAEDFRITPDQIVDQVGHLATAEGIRPEGMTQRDFTRLAQEFRIELEDHYDEVYSNAEWKQLAGAAWTAKTQGSTGFENEEYGDIDDEPRLAMGQRDWESEADDRPGDGYLRHRANGGHGSRGQWEFDQDQKGPVYRHGSENEEFGDLSRRTPVQRTLNRAPQELTTPGLLAKCARVVKSVQTPAQYDTAKKYAELVFSKLADEIHTKKGFGGLNDHMSLMNAIQADLRKARQRLWPVGQENEERGWPSEEGRESPENYDDIGSDELGGQQGAQGEMGPDEWDSLNAEINQPWDDEDSIEPPFPGDEDPQGRFQENEEREFDRTEARAINRGNASYGRADLGSYKDEADRQRQARAAVDSLWGSSRKPKTQENEEGNMSQEQRGWDDAKAGTAPRYPNDTEYMAGHQRAGKLVAPKTGAENEESAPSKGSLLKSLLTQRKEVSAKASETAKKYKTEGAAAFHEIRMKHCKSPYCPQKQGDEHTAWMKGWEEAAKEHYSPEEIDPKAKAKAKKQAAKPKR